MKTGKVYIVGAGPGDEKLISVRGLELIQRADVLVYDRLASSGLLKKAPECCEKIYAGKKPDHHTLRQEEINFCLIEKAREGKTVVRLKGGDPFIFGRGGEEAEALQKEGITFEIVPGISSFYSACAYAGIPVTYRDYASSFHVFTGHFQKSGSLDYKNIAAMEGTLIFLMGMKNLDKITQGLMREGKDRKTPAAIVEWGTTSRQKEAVGELCNICQLAKEKEMSHPAIILIGNVIEAKKHLEWQKMRPLWGKRVLLTRTTDSSSQIFEMLTELGAEVRELPTIKIGKPKSYCALDRCIRQIESYSWLFFTSVNGVQYFFERIKELKIDIRKIGKAKIFCIGERTKRSLESRGIFVDYMPSDFNSDAAASEMSRFITSDDKVLYPTSSLAGDRICASVKGLGAICHEVEAYSNEINDIFEQSIAEEVKEGTFHAIIFASSSQVENYHKIFAGKTGDAKICSIGKMTTKTAEALGFHVCQTAKTASAQGIVEAVEIALNS